MRDRQEHDYRGEVTALLGENTIPVSDAVDDGVAGSPSWDPYDVWLKRVKQPRDLLPRHAEATAANTAAAAATGPAVDSAARAPDALPRAV